MEESQLLERWKGYRDRFPDSSKELKEILCALYEDRHDQEKFNNGLNRLQELLSDQAQEMLGVNAADKQGLIAWASAMGFLGLIKKEHDLTGRHAHS